MFPEPNWPLFRGQEVTKVWWHDTNMSADKSQLRIAVFLSRGGFNPTLLLLLFSQPASSPGTHLCVMLQTDAKEFPDIGLVMVLANGTEARVRMTPPSATRPVLLTFIPRVPSWDIWESKMPTLKSISSSSPG